MNPKTQTYNQLKMNERELEMGVSGTKNSWHQEYKDSAWVFLGGLPYEMTEGDVICMLSQYGEIVHINLIRDHTTGKSRGFGFLCYMDQRSTVLAVDNLNGVKVLHQLIRVDHVHNYKLPKDLEKLDQDKKKLFMEGCAPKMISGSEPSSEEEVIEAPSVKVKKEKKKKKEKKHKKKKKAERSDESDEDEDDRKRKGREEREKPKSRDSDRDDDDDGRPSEKRVRRDEARERDESTDRRGRRDEDRRPERNGDRERSRERRRSRERTRSRERRKRSRSRSKERRRRSSS